MKAGASVNGELVGAARSLTCHLLASTRPVHPQRPMHAPALIGGRSRGDRREIKGRSKQDQGEIEGMDRSVDGEGDQQWRHLQPAKGSSRCGALKPPARMLGTPARGVALTSGVLPERGVALAGGLAPGGEVALAVWLMRR